MAIKWQILPIMPTKKSSGWRIDKVDENRALIPKNSSQRVASWQLTLGKKFTGHRRVRKYFGTEREAKDHLALLTDERKAEGHDAFSLTPAQRRETKQCLEELAKASDKAGKSFTLWGAVSFFLTKAIPSGGNMNFAKAQVAFIANRRASNLKERYIRNLDSQFKRLNEEFAATPVNLITMQDIERWLDVQGQSPKTRNNYIITLRTFFDYCLNQKWCSENPASALNKAKSEDAPTGILTVDEVSRLLATAVALKTPVLPAMLIQLFAGLRRSEVCALDWSEVKPDLIEVSGAKSKTRSRRTVEIQPNLREWLEPYRLQRGSFFPSSKPNMKLSSIEDAYNKAVREVVAAANASGADKGQSAPPIVWKHNCLRHTCASMHLACFENESSTALQMGHSAEVLHQHYKGLVTSDEAKRYWNLKPSREPVASGSVDSVAPSTEAKRRKSNNNAEKRAGLGGAQGTAPAVRASRARSGDNGGAKRASRRPALKPPIP